MHGLPASMSDKQEQHDPSCAYRHDAPWMCDCRTYLEGEIPRAWLRELADMAKFLREGPCRNHVLTADQAEKWAAILQFLSEAE